MRMGFIMTTVCLADNPYPEKAQTGGAWGEELLGMPQETGPHF